MGFAILRVYCIKEKKKEKTRKKKTYNMEKICKN